MVAAKDCCLRNEGIGDGRGAVASCVVLPPETDRCGWTAVPKGPMGSRPIAERGVELDDLFETYDVHDAHQLGKLGEELAARYLQGKGFAILERNYRCSYGEADLICRHGEETVLVEVKTRLGINSFPEEAVDARKIRRYRNITLDYIKGAHGYTQVRFDVMAFNVVAPSDVHLHHFVGVCNWEG